MKTSYTKFKKIIYLFITPILLFLPNLVLAAQAVGDATDKLPVTKLAPQPTDISVGLLSQIFGTVTGSGLIGPTSTILGKMFNAFNSGILILAGTILAYTTVRSVMELAHQIQPMGRKFSWWQPVRIAMGVALLVPQATGYSFLNSIVMWVTLQGVGLADLVWNEAVDYLQKGGVIYTQPAAPTTPAETYAAKTSEIDLHIISNPLPPDAGSGLSGTSALLKSQICTHSLENIVNKANRSIIDDINANPQNYPAKGSPEYNQLMQEYTQVSFAPSYVDGPHGGAYFPGQDYPKNNPIILKGDCGAYSWYTVPTKCVTPGPGCESYQQSYRDTKKTGLTQAINEIDSIAAHAANNDIRTRKNQDGENTLTFDDDFSFNTLASSRLVSAASDYQSIIYPMRVFAGSGYVSRAEPTIADKELAKQLSYEQLKKDGWIAAARAYFVFVTPPTAPPMIDDEHYIFETLTPPPQGTPSPGTKQYGCSGKTCPHIKAFIEKYSKNSDSDKIKLWEKLFWTYIVTGQYDDTTKKGSGAIGLANDLNQATYKAAIAGRLVLPAELKQFIKEGKFRISFISTSSAADIAFGVIAAFASVLVGGAPALILVPAVIPSYFAAQMALAPLNTGINSVVCVWAVNLGVRGEKPKCKNQDQNPVTPHAYNPPLLKLQSIGNQMIYESISIWAKLLQNLSIIAKIFLIFAGANLLVGLTAAPATIFGVTIGVGQIVNSAFQYLSVLTKMLIEMPLFMAMPIVFVVTGFMMTLGVTLSYYIPLVPFMLFTFGVIAWLSFVIEAMIAAPIVALAITYPEGHELLGRAVTALELLLAVFVRPAAMIFGLIAALIMSYIALDVLNLGFGAIIGSIFFGAGKIKAGAPLTATRAATGAMAQLTNAFIIIIYVYIVIAIMNQCFSLIVVIPSKILRWIGIRHEAMEEMAALREVKGGVEAAARGVGEGARAISGFKPSLPVSRVEGQAAVKKAPGAGGAPGIGRPKGGGGPPGGKVPPI